MIDDGRHHQVEILWGWDIKRNILSFGFSHHVIVKISTKIIYILYKNNVQGRRDLLRSPFAYHLNRKDETRN